MKHTYKITKSIIYLLLCVPTTLLAFVNVSFIPTSGSTLNLVTTQNATTSTNLDLELKSLANGQFTSEAGPEEISSGFSITDPVINVVVLPVSLSNNQITDKIILIPLSTANIFATIHVLNADLTNPQSINVSGIIGTTPTLSTTPILISNNSGVFIIIGTTNLIDSTLRIYNLNTTNNTLSEVATQTYSLSDIEDIIPIDENIIAVISREVATGNITADIRSLITNTSLGQYNLNSANDIEVTYDPSRFRTLISSSGSQVDISDAPSPYGVNKVFSQS